MNKPLHLSWSEVRFGGLKTVYEKVEQSLHAVGIDFYYLIGAQARDLWYLAEGLDSRITRDIDFALLVTDEVQYEAVKRDLQTRFGFTSSINAFALRSPEGDTVDILPYREMLERDSVIVGGGGITTLNMEGFWEVAAAGTTTVRFEDAQSTFRIATLPAIVMLKFLAYNDRPEMRTKDVGDIWHIISNFFDLQTYLFYEVHYDVLEHIDVGRAFVSARIIGREMRPILQQSNALDRQIRTLISEHTQVTESPFIKLLERHFNISASVLKAVFAELLRGLDESAPTS